MIVQEYTSLGVAVRDHLVVAPLDHAHPEQAERVEVFAREVVAASRRDDDLPLLLYLQGGPGGKSPRPLRPSGWLARALKTHRVVLLDQRGTGRSSPVQAEQMSRFPSGAAAADHLRHFRADSIVADAELLRRSDFDARPWATLGQSFGGFITLTYLSTAPEGLTACYVAGGLASVQPSAAEVYRRTYPRVEAKNARFRATYPHTGEVVDHVADLLADRPVRLPDGDLLDVLRLQLVGIDFGMAPGAARLHWLFDEALVGDDRLSDTFLDAVTNLTSFRDNPLFMVMQESIYGVPGGGSTGWAADAERARQPGFDPGARPLLLTGEMAYPWMFEEISGLRPFAAAADALATRSDWGPLYDLDRLGANTVPVAAAVYHDDMYVDAGLSLETARVVGNVDAWVTNEYEHDGLGEERVLERLMEMVADYGGELKR